VRPSQGTISGTRPVCAAEGATEDPTTVIDDTVVEQTKPLYDDLGRVWLSRWFRRNDNATGTGELKHPSDAEPKARVSHTVTWFDELGRTKKVVDYGTRNRK